MSFLHRPSVIPAQAGISKLNDNNSSGGLAIRVKANCLKNQRKAYTKALIFESLLCGIGLIIRRMGCTPVL